MKIRFIIQTYKAMQIKVLEHKTLESILKIIAPIIAPKNMMHLIGLDLHFLIKSLEFVDIQVFQNP